MFLRITHKTTPPLTINLEATKTIRAASNQLEVSYLDGTYDHVLLSSIPNAVAAAKLIADEIKATAQVRLIDVDLTPYQWGDDGRSEQAPE